MTNSGRRIAFFKKDGKWFKAIFFGDRLEVRQVSEAKPLTLAEVKVRRANER